MIFRLLPKTCPALAIGLTVLLAGATGSAAAELNKILPVEWRAVPLNDAINELSSRLNTPYVLDTSVTQETLTRPVRMSATRLTGRQAFRWTVRTVGFDAVLINGAMLIAAPDRLPRTWQIMGAIGPDGNPSRTDPQKTGLHMITESEALRVDLDWMDAPLSRVSRDISDRFGVDVIFHSSILSAEPLIRLQGQDLNLETIRQAFAEQIGATCRYEDGVFWVQPDQANAKREGMELPEPPSTMDTTPMGPLPSSRPIRICVQNEGWNTLERQFSQTSGINCRIQVASGVEAPIMSARSTILEGLEALRLLAGWSWQFTLSPADQPADLVIHVPAPGGSDEAQKMN